MMTPKERKYLEKQTSFNKVVEDFEEKTGLSFDDIDLVIEAETKKRKESEHGTTTKTLLEL